MDRVRCSTGASCAFWVFGRAIGAASASGAGGRVSRNEQVVGSIPTGGSLSCCSVVFIDLNFDSSPISVERFVERVEWSRRPDTGAGWLRSVIAGSCVSSARPRRPGKDRSASCAPGGRASGPGWLGKSVCSAACASPHAQSSAIPFRGVQRAAGLRVVLCGRRPTLTAGPAASPDGVTECCDELNTYAQVRLDMYLIETPRAAGQALHENRRSGRRLTFRSRPGRRRCNGKSARLQHLLKGWLSPAIVAALGVTEAQTAFCRYAWLTARSVRADGRSIGAGVLGCELCNRTAGV